MSETAAKQASFEGWGIVEIMGHQRHIGFVTTEAYGAAVLFRIDTPELPERDFVLTAPEYVGHNWTPAGAKVRRPASPAVSVLIGPSSVYRLSPCTEQAARQAIEKLESRPLILLEMPEGKLIENGGQITSSNAFDDRTFDCCGGNPEDGHNLDCETFDEDQQEDLRNGAGIG